MAKGMAKRSGNHGKQLGNLPHPSGSTIQAPKMLSHKGKPTLGLYHPMPWGRVIVTALFNAVVISITIFSIRHYAEIQNLTANIADTIARREIWRP